MGTLAVRVLLIDDKARHLRGLERQIQASGFRTFLAGECEEALSQARLTHFDVVVISVPLIGLQDTDLLEVIRHINSAYYLPIICLEDNLDSQKKLATLELGADVILDRQVEPSVLIAVHQNRADGGNL